MGEATPTPPGSLPRLPYQPPASRQKERRRHLQRLGRWVLYALLGIVALPALYIGGVIVYQSLRHRTTVAEVRAQIASLGPHANAQAVLALLKQKQFDVQWRRSGDLIGSLDAGADFPFMRRIDITVCFDNHGQITSVDVQEKTIGP